MAYGNIVTTKSQLPLSSRLVWFVSVVTIVVLGQVPAVSAQQQEPDLKPKQDQVSTTTAVPSSTEALPPQTSVSETNENVPAPTPKDDPASQTSPSSTTEASNQNETKIPSGQNPGPESNPTTTQKPNQLQNNQPQLCKDDGQLDKNQTAAATPTVASNDQGNLASQDKSSQTDNKPEQPAEPTPGIANPQNDCGDDHLLYEGKAEDKSKDLEVPEPERLYGGQAEYQQPEILWHSIDEAKVKLDKAVTEHEQAVDQVRTLRSRIKELDHLQDQFDIETQLAVGELDSASARLRSRAIEVFNHHMAGSAVPDVGVFSADRSSDDIKRAKMNETIMTIEEAETANLAERRKAIDIEALEVFDRKVGAENLELEAVELAEERQIQVDQAEIELAAFQIGSQVFVEGAVFPIDGMYRVPLVDSYGFPRMPGTSDAHWHEGIDIFAPNGTPLVAAERGIVNNIGSGRLGGLKFWLKGESGSEWYYAHLDSFAPGLSEGQVVEAGELLGYVGNTGNARTTPPHLHMELHPGGGDPVNPYPLLRVLSDIQRQAFDNGQGPEFKHEPYVAGSGPNLISQQQEPKELAATDGEES